MSIVPRDSVTSTVQPGASPSAGTQVNIPMAVMSCIGILAVVWGHGIGAFSQIAATAFPYYSWHMPFFMFISGYFFNRKMPVGPFLLKKVKTLLLPALFSNLLCGIVSMTIGELGIATYGRPITLEALFITPFTSGYQFYINVSIWFICTLFVIEVLSALLDRLFRGKADAALLSFFTLLGLGCCYLATRDPGLAKNDVAYTLLRTGYLFPFFGGVLCIAAMAKHG